MRFHSEGSSRCSSLAATWCALLPATSGLDSQGWTERADTDIDINDFLPLAAAVYIHIRMHSERYPGPAPFQLPDPLQPARSLTFSQLSPLSSPGASLTTLHSCTQLGRSNKLSQKNVVSWRKFTLSLERPPADLIQVLEKRLSLLCQQCSMGRSLRASSSRAFPLVFWQGALRALPTSTSKISHSLWRPGPVALGALCGSSRARSGFVPRLPGNRNG